MIKTIDTKRAANLAKNHAVFHSNRPNEITINNTEKSSEQVCQIILKQLKIMAD